MPPASDWRSAQAAVRLLQLDRSGFAIEFLRRNPVYKEDYNRTQERVAAGLLQHDSAVENLARRWGLSFPTSS